jgi:hypothetical protein
MLEHSKNPRLLEALRVLASIALVEANGNSDPDDMATALDGIVSDAATFFRLNGLSPRDYTGPPG